MSSLRPFLPLFALFGLACGEAIPAPSAPSLLSSSSYSSPSVASSPSIPQRSDGRGEIIVRPDLVCVPFVLRIEGPDPKARLDLLEKATGVVAERFSAATGGASTSKMLGVSVNAMPSYSKVKEDAAPASFVSTVDGAIEVPLAADANYWARARLLAALVSASHAAAPALPSAGEGEPEIEAAFGAPEIKLKDPESHRAELVKRWVERARAFSRAAESQGAPLNIVSCEPPGAITQAAVSVERVGLSLPVNCRIDVTRVAQ